MNEPSISMAPTARIPQPFGLVSGPFHERLSALSRQQAWSNWAGYASPTVLENVEFEYFAIRNQATLYDVSPMRKYSIEGPQAETVANRLVTRDIRKLRPGRVAYVIWCDEQGRVIDDGTLFRLAPDRFRLCCQDSQLGWLLDIAWGFDVTIRDVSREFAGLALQGPTSASVLRAAGVTIVEAMKPFDWVATELGGFPVGLSRTGFTGDLGYELWMDPSAALAVWDRLMVAGADWGLRPVGYQAVDMARIEAGFLLPRIDFLSARTVLDARRAATPFELGLERLVDLDKPHFNGRRSLLALRRQAPARRLLAIEIDRDKPAAQALVYHRGRREVGMVTSALWSPTCKRNIAFAWIEDPWCRERHGDLWVEIYLQKELRWERRMERCRVVDRPFFSHPRRSLTPPAAH